MDIFFPWSNTKIIASSQKPKENNNNNNNEFNKNNNNKIKIKEILPFRTFEALVEEGIEHRHDGTMIIQLIQIPIWFQNPTRPQP